MFTNIRTAKLSTIALSAVLLASPQAFAADNNSNENVTIEEIRADVHGAIADARDFAADKRDEAYSESKTALKKMDRYIDRKYEAAGDAWISMTEEARENYNESMRMIREKRSDVAEWLGSMKTATAESWTDVKTGFSDAFDELSDAVTESDKSAGQS